MKPKADDVDSLREKNDVLCNELKIAQAMCATVTGRKADGDDATRSPANLAKVAAQFANDCSDDGSYRIPFCV